MRRFSVWRTKELEDPTGKRPWWLAPLFVVFTTMGAIMALVGEGTDRVWGLICVLFFGASGFVMYAPKGAAGPGVAVERDERHGGRWALSFPWDRRRQLLRTVGALSMAVAGLLMALFADDLSTDSMRNRPPTVLRAAGALCFVTFGGFGALGLARRNVTPRMMLLEEGMEFDGPGGRIFVPWDATSDVRVLSVNHNDMIGVSVYDPARLEIGPIARLFLPLNRRFAGADLTYPLDAFVAPPQVVMDAIRRFAGDPDERRRLARGDVDVSELSHTPAATGGSADG